VIIIGLALVLFALAALSGLQLGAVRTAMSVIGLGVGAVLALPLSPLLKPLIGLAGLSHALAAWLLPPLAILVLTVIVFLILGQAVHGRVERHFKYKSDEVELIKWERLNKRVGIAVGLAAGIAWLVVFGIVIHAAGYLTTQVFGATGENQSPAVRYLNQARENLRDTGLEKLVAAVDPVPENYYALADVLGMLYHNPVVQGRLGDYPGLLPLLENPELKALAEDRQFSELLLTQPDAATLWNHPRVQAILNNPEVIDLMKQLEPRDLLRFLETGTSPKFDGEPILGRWQFDPIATLSFEYRRTPQITAAQIRALKTEFEQLASLLLLALPDQTLVLRGGEAAATGKWIRAGNKYNIALQGRLTVARIPIEANQAYVEKGLLHVRSAASERELVFEKP
jgi:hypothetical protein